MPTPGDVAHSKGDLMRRVHRLERELQALRAARRLESASVGAGGLRIIDGGDLRAEGGGRIRYLDADGNQLVYIGPLFQQGEFVGNGLFVERADGTRLATFFEQGVRLRDPDENLMLRLTDGGWDAPRLPVSYGFRNREIPDGEWVELARGRCLKRSSHVRVRVTALLVADNEAEFRLTEVFSGATVGTETVPTSGPGLIEEVNPREFGEDCLFVIEARRSAGTSEINLAYVDAFEQLVL